MRSILLILLFISTQSFAADKYIDTSCSLNGEGTAAACAASGGGVGAWNTGASWSNGAGNTTYIKRGTTVTNLATSISSANQTFDDYGTSTDPCPIISKSGTTFTFSVSADNVTFNDLCITGSQSSAVVSTSNANTSFNRVKVYGNNGGGVGIRFNNSSSNGSVTDSEVYNIDDDGIGVSATATGTFTITNLNCHDVDKTGGTGDCIQAYDGAVASLIISGGTWRKETAFKQAIRYSGTGSVIIKDRPKIYLVPTGTTAGQAVSIQGAANVNIGSIYVDARGKTWAPIIFLNMTGNGQVSNCELLGGDYGIWSSIPSGNLKISNCNIRGSALAGVYNTIDVTGGTTEVQGTFIQSPTSFYNANTSAILKSDYNTFAIPSFRWNGATVTGISSWQSTSSQDSHSQVKSGPEIIRTTRN